jgi:hypothetical protein
MFAVAVAAQTPNETPKTDEQKRAKEEIEKKAFALVDELVKEVSSLRLADNRIMAQATLGDLLWKRDEKRARALFKQAIDGLSDLVAGAKRPSDPASAFLEFGLFEGGYNQVHSQLRQRVLKIIGERDPQLARDFLRSTRKNTRENGYDEDADQELGLAAQIADSDPQQALQIAEEQVEKRLTTGVIGVLVGLRSKDSEAADKLTAAIMKKLRSSDLSTDYSIAYFALSLIRTSTHSGQNSDEQAGSGKPAAKATPALDEKTIGELMNLVVGAALSVNTEDGREGDKDEPDPAGYLLMELKSMIEQVEKYAPGRAAALKAKIARVDEDDDPEEKTMREYQSVMNNGSVDAIMEAASKAPAEMKDSFYHQAMMKALSDGDADKARQIADEHISDPDRRDQMMDLITQQEVWKAAADGKLEKTRELIAPLSPVQRAAVLTELASTALEKGDKKIVAQILGEARGAISNQPSNFIELMTMLEIARIYSSVEANKSFEILEPAIDQLNTLIAAASVLDGFEIIRHFREGELAPQGQSILGGMVLLCVRNTGLLARTDFDRAKQTADRFQRGEVRTLARLSVAQVSVFGKLNESEFDGSFLRGLYTQWGRH